MVGDVPIGWGKTDDGESKEALRVAFDEGVNFYDTADFYGLGHSEKLLGEVFGNRDDVIIATKVGHRVNKADKIYVDYSRKYVVEACEGSLKRLKRDCIDYYQLHTAKIEHLEQGECVEAMQTLQEQGKIRYWGLSLSTFSPQTEAEFMLKSRLGDGFQLVLNIINQRALPVIKKAHQAGYGIIARMPLQFGLLAGKFDEKASFSEDDHRSFRLTGGIISRSIERLRPIWERTKGHGATKVEIALAYILSYPEVTTVIPGIRNKAQAEQNTDIGIRLSEEDKAFIENAFDNGLTEIVELMEQQG